MKSHSERTGPDYKYQCELCPKSYDKRCSWTNHMKAHLNNGDGNGQNKIRRPNKVDGEGVLHSCDICNKQFEKRCALTNHKKIHFRAPSTSEIRPSWKKKIIKKPKDAENEEIQIDDMPICIICNLQFEAVEDFNEHMEENHPEDEEISDLKARILNISSLIKI